MYTDQPGQPGVRVWTDPSGRGSWLVPIGYSAETSPFHPDNPAFGMLPGAQPFAAVYSGSGESPHVIVSEPEPVPVPFYEYEDFEDGPMFPPAFIDPRTAGGEIVEQTEILTAGGVPETNWLMWAVIAAGVIWIMSPSPRGRNR